MHKQKKRSELAAASDPTMGERLRVIQADMIKKIADHGWFILSIFEGEKGEAPFSYSLGANTVGLPDLIISGLALPGGKIINDILKEARNGMELKEGIQLTQFADIPLVLRRLKPAQVRDRMFQAFSFYGHEDWDVFQVVYPDPNGIFPGQEGYDFPLQELFWTR